MSALLDVAVAASGPVATVLIGYVARVARRVDRRLDDVDRNTRAIYGDDTVSWPGLMQLVDESPGHVDDVRTDGGERQ